jgi:hypothetical protein
MMGPIGLNRAPLPIRDDDLLKDIQPKVRHFNSRKSRFFDIFNGIPVEDLPSVPGETNGPCYQAASPEG